MADRHDNDPDDVFPEEYDGPTVRIPQVDVPNVDTSVSDSDAMTDSPLADLFVLHVILWNAVLMSLSLGAMLIYFRGNWATGGQLIAIGIILTLYGAYRWPGNADSLAARLKAFRNR